MNIKTLLLSVLLTLIPTLASTDSTSAKQTSSSDVTVSELLFSKKYNPTHRIQDSVMLVAVGKSNGQLLGTGTAFLVDNKKGLLVTAAHVIESGMAFDLSMSTDVAIAIRLPNDMGVVIADLVKVNMERDLALLQVNTADLSSLRSVVFSDDIYSGQLSFVIGFPLSYGQMITCGVISSVDRSIDVQGTKYTGVFYTDTIVNPGNSGGPIINSKGQVIGIIQYNSWIHRYASGHPSKYIINFIKDQANVRIGK